MRRFILKWGVCVLFLRVLFLLGSTDLFCGILFEACVSITLPNQTSAFSFIDFSLPFSLYKKHQDFIAKRITHQCFHRGSGTREATENDVANVIFMLPNILFFLQYQSGLPSSTVPQTLELACLGTIFLTLSLPIYLLSCLFVSYPSIYLSAFINIHNI